MKTSYLLPVRFKKLGWFLFLPGFLLGLLYFFLPSEPEFLNIKVFSVMEKSIMGETRFLCISENNVFDEIICLLILIGGLLIAFSKEKTEDEFIAKIRTESLVWATYVNYIVLILSIIFIYDMMFFWILAINMFTLLFVFVIRFQWAMYKSKTQVQHEE